MKTFSKNCPHYDYSLAKIVVDGNASSLKSYQLFFTPPGNGVSNLFVDNAETILLMEKRRSFVDC